MDNHCKRFWAVLAASFATLAAVAFFMEGGGMNTRRNFVRGLSGLGAIVATGHAPAIVRSMIAARGTMLGGAHAWTNPYITDGLIAMWDGEWNAGGGVHDTEATTWKDLSGNGYDAVVRVGTWDADGLNGGNTTSVNQCWTVVSKSMAEADVAHVEFVLSGFLMSTWATICYLGGRTRSPTFYVDNRFEPTAGYLPFYNYPDLSTSHRIVDGVFAVDYNISKAWHNGSEMGVKEGSQYNIYPSNFIVAAGLVRNSSVSGYLNGGKICRLAAYSRSLTADEIAANYSIDKKRFPLAS